MEDKHLSQRGIYLAYPTSAENISIFRQKEYKTKVNNTHTKVGIAKDSFEARIKGYRNNFYGNVEFILLAIIEEIEELKKCEHLILIALRSEFENEKPAREWFRTNDHGRVIDIVHQVLSSHNKNIKLLVNH